MEKWRKEHLKAVWALKELLDIAEAKLNAPVQVSFLNVRAFLQDVEVRNKTATLSITFFVFLLSVALQQAPSLLETS